MFLHWGDVLAYFDESVTHLPGFCGGRCVEAGGGHGVDLEEGPHGPQEPLMPQEQGCHLALCVPTDRHRLLRVQRRRGTGQQVHIPRQAANSIGLRGIQSAPWLHLQEDTKEEEKTRKCQRRHHHLLLLLLHSLEGAARECIGCLSVHKMTNKM